MNNTRKLVLKDGRKSGSFEVSVTVVLDFVLTLDFFLVGDDRLLTLFSSLMRISWWESSFSCLNDCMIFFSSCDMSSLNTVSVANGLVVDIFK